MSEPEAEFNAQFFEQFLDDYFAEAEEHLRSLRRNILDLEDSLSTDRKFKKNTLDELFRSFHTLKGISAMAGVSAAEAMAHSMESYLRLLREDQAQLSEDGLSALIRGTQKIAEIVAARRENGEIPPITDETRLLDLMVSLGGSSGRPAESSEFTEGPWRSPRYLFTFVSAPELAERNVNVNTVRERLQEIGAIIKSSPTVRGDGKVAFEFIVETNADESEFEKWTVDGIEYDLAEAENVLEDEVVYDVSPAGTARGGLSGPSSVVRVELSRLDGLMVMLGDLVVCRSKLEELLRQIGDGVPSELRSSLDETNRSIERQLRSLRDGVMRTRMSPIGEVFERLEFAVRELARDSGKKVRLDIAGENTEIDKMLVEKVVDPLLHLVRNAVSHGIEPAAERVAKNKPEYGTIRLNATTIGETIALEVADDGAGIDVRRVRSRAKEKGISLPSGDLDESTLMEVLSTPGFSTREEADKASGRGVGMDVVRRAVDELQGTIRLETRAGTGSVFKIQLPLTLAIADALIVSVGDERFAVPQAGVNEVVEIEKASVRRLENNEIVDHRGAALPLIRLSRLFRLPDGQRDIFHAFVVGEGKQAVGIAVDRVIGQAEIVIRALSDSLTQVSGISGATELGDGRIVLILDVPAITRRLRKAI
jgi:two-component system, chemotaxis family, sensor kinase CheA